MNWGFALWLSNNSFGFLDIEKRKSFADMKLAVVASGGDFNFDKSSSSTLSIPNNNMVSTIEESDGCNGHKQEKQTVEFKLGGESNGAESEHGQDGPELKEEVEHIEEEQVQERKPDPVTEICPHLEVKIADLGNACWVVSIQRN